MSDSADAASADLSSPVSRASTTEAVPTSTFDRPGTAPGMNAADARERSELARFLGKEIWPASTETLRATAQENHATEHVLAALEALPVGGEFQNLQALARELGIGTEESSFRS